MGLRLIFGWLETLVSEILIESRMDSLYLQNPLSLEISEVGKTILRL